MTIFTIKPDAGVWWPVMFDRSIDGGKTEEVTFELKFKRIGLSEVEPMRKLQDVDFLTAAASAWRGVNDESGPLPFDRASITLVIDVPGVAEAIARAWQAFVLATPETRLGNSRPSRAGGPAAAAATAETPVTAQP